MEENDYNSPVAFEIPVFVSQTLANKLMVYRAPLEDQQRDDDFQVSACRVSEDYALAIDEEVDTDSVNYNRSKGEQMAINTDGDKNLEEMMFPKRLMDKRMLVSSVDRGSNLAVGVLQDNELHLTAAIGSAILRPTFRYLDQRKEAKEKTEDGTDEEEDMQQVSVKFARRENEAKRKAFNLTGPTDEKWRSADYYDSSSSRAEITTGKLFCARPGEVVTDPGGRRTQPVPDTDVNSHGLALTRLTSLPLLDRIRTILSHARVIDIARIHRLLGEPSNPGDIQDRVKVVQHVAVLVQGCWVIQSDIAIPKDTTPHGVPAALARCARDYILYLFTKNRCLSRKTIMEVVKLPGAVIKTMLEEVSRLNSEKEWEFALPTDHQFMLNNPDVVQRQQAKWELRIDQLLAGLRPPDATAAPGGRHRRRSGRDSFSSDNEDGRRNYPGSRGRRTGRSSESRS